MGDSVCVWALLIVLGRGGGVCQVGLLSPSSPCFFSRPLCSLGLGLRGPFLADAAFVPLTPPAASECGGG